MTVNWRTWLPLVALSMLVMVPAPATANDRPDVNTTYLQPFANYNLGGGLSVGVSAEATGNWEADQAWTAPLLFNVSKVTLLGKRPVSFVLAAGPTIASPTVAPVGGFARARRSSFPGNTVRRWSPE